MVTFWCPQCEQFREVLANWVGPEEGGRGLDIVCGGCALTLAKVVGSGPRMEELKKVLCPE